MEEERKGLSERFWEIINEDSESEAIQAKAAKLVEEAPDDEERDGLMALLYYNGWGVPRDFDKATEYAEKAAEKNEGVALYLLGLMCWEGLTPDQAEGGSRQRYDQYDAESWMEAASKANSVWAEDAHLWLGDYFMDSAKGGDPEVGIEHYEAIGEHNREAAGKLSDYYWDQMEYRAEPDEELEKKVYKWTMNAAEMNPHDYAFRMGWILEAGIGCKPSFRLARKYFEDSFDTGHWEGAEAISEMYKERYEDESYPADEREHCRKEMERWQRLAKRARENEYATEPDPSVEED